MSKWFSGYVGCGSQSYPTPVAPDGVNNATEAGALHESAFQLNGSPVISLLIALHGLQRKKRCRCSRKLWKNKIICNFVIENVIA